MSVKKIKIDSTLQRVLLLALVLMCLIFVFFAAKWFLGNSIAGRVIQREVADLAISLAPSDPRTHFVKGILLESSFQPNDLPKSLAEYEKAVALSPNDYRLWLAYGKVLERNGEAAKAEKALEKALELAPNYAEVQWVYGNILLRQDKTKEGFAAIRKAVEGNSKFAAPAATTAWDIYEGDIDEVENAIGDSAPVKAALASFLINQKRFDDGLKIWNDLPENDRKTTFRSSGEQIIKDLISNKKYRSALPIKSLLADDSSQKIAVGKITNGGFEEVLVTAPDTFEWKITDGNKPVIGLNKEQKQSGENSLAIIFNASIGKDFRSVSQTVAVESDTFYEFEVYYKSKLETTNTLKWEIIDAASGKIIAATEAIEAEADWTSLKVNFKTPEDTEGITVRLIRETCASADCSINGTVWFDEVSLR